MHLLFTTLVLFATLEERIEAVLRAPHGLDAPLDPFSAGEARALCKEPGATLMALERWLEPQALSALNDAMTQYQAGNAIALLVLCGEKGKAKAAETGKVIRLLRDEKLTAALTADNDAVERMHRLQQADALLSLERILLSEFAAQKDARLVQDLLSRVESDAQLQVETIEYFSLAAPGVAAIGEVLKRLRDKTRWPALQARIDAYLAYSAKGKKQ